VCVYLGFFCFLFGFIAQLCTIATFHNTTSTDLMLYLKRFSCFFPLAIIYFLLYLLIWLLSFFDFYIFIAAL